MKKLVFAIALVACRSPERTQTTEQAPSVTPSATASVAAPLVDAGDLRPTIVEAWNRAHNDHAATALDSLYADEVLFYGRRASRGDCIAVKKGLLAQSPDFKQTLRDLRFDENRAKFVKTVTAKGKTKDYPSYLELARRGSGWVITAESDDMTDKAIAEKHCTEIAWGKEFPYDVSDLELTGRIMRADAPNATGVIEIYWRLNLDKPACLPPGQELVESPTIQLYGDGAGDPKAFIGKHVRAKGDAFVQHTAHHHEPIVMNTKSFAVLP